MKKILIFHSVLLLLLMLAGISRPLSAQHFIHPGIYQTRADLDYMKRQVLAGEQPWKNAFDQVKAQTKLDFVPEPEPHIISGPWGNPNVGGRELTASANMAYNAALVWYITGDKAYADKAIGIISAWAPNVWDFDENNAKLLAGLTGYVWCNAAEILRYTPSGWTQKHTEDFTRMMMTAYYPVLRFYFPEANGNWDGAIAQSIMAIAVFTDNRPMFDNAVGHFLYGNNNGALLKYIYPSGQCQETARDQGHVQMGLQEFAGAAHIAYTQGVDLYGVADNRLALGYEYTARVMMGEYPQAYGTISELAKDLRSNSYEFAYRHYTAKGYEMPYTKRAADAIRDKSSLTLLAALRAPGPKQDINRGVPQPSAIGYPAGAMAGATAEMPAGSLVVKPGESLQAAIDKAAGTGKWVIADAGLHTLPEALVIPSGTVLAGKGLATILHCKPDVIRSIINTDDNLHDVTLRDFVLEGAVSPDYGTDPNSGRMSRALRLAPRRAGVIFLSRADGQMKNITFRNITVKNFTRHGIFVSGAANVQVLCCDLSDSGSSLVPGPRLHHNLSLTHVQDVRIQDSRMATSPHGCGISLEHCANASVVNCEIARNEWFGIRLVGNDNVTISKCLIEANTATGIMSEFLYSGNRNLTLTDNLIQYNNGYGIESYAAPGLKSSGNRLVGNRTGEEKISSEKIVLMQ